MSPAPPKPVPPKPAQQPNTRPVVAGHGGHGQAGLRHLIPCPSCQRQWDASGHPVGAHFHCSCGQDLVIPATTPGRDAAVVRCGQCGGARERGAVACGYCHADFTIHEQDLHTICPGCLARISDRARYCHHCGLGIHAEGWIGEATAQSCPGCGDGYQLTRRQIGSMSLPIDECARCAGIWVTTDVFETVLGTARSGAPATVVSQGAVRPAVGIEPRASGAALYRVCPKCRKHMNRQNFGRKSGVIVDACKCGVWFDLGELDRILAWVRKGGEQVAAQAAAHEEREATRRARIKLPPMETRDRDPLFGNATTATVGADLIGALLHWLTR